jgi:hypothetical protein
MALKEKAEWLDGVLTVTCPNCGEVWEFPDSQKVICFECGKSIEVEEPNESAETI